MGNFGGKIRGHSESEDKYKKEDAQSEKLVNSKLNNWYANIEIKKPKRIYSGFRLLKHSIAFLTILTMIICLGLMIYRVDGYSVQKDKKVIEDVTYYETQKVISEQKFLENLYTGAKNEFNSGSFTSAHEKLYALLLVDEDNNPAEKLLIKVLIAKCENFDIGCKQLEYYSKYLEKKYGAFKS